MTTEERFERIEHVTAGLVEQFRVEREENRQLWRETQRHIEEVDRRLGARIEELAVKIEEVDHRLGARIDEVGQRIQALAEESRAADKRLEERIGSLVSAIGKFMARE